MIQNMKMRRSLSNLEQTAGGFVAESVEAQIGNVPQVIEFSTLNSAHGIRINQLPQQLRQIFRP